MNWIKLIKGNGMSRICQITGKKPMNGNRRSYAMNASKRWFKPNVHTHRFWSNSRNKFYTLRISAKGIRIIDKLGIDRFLLTAVFKNKKIM